MNYEQGLGHLVDLAAWAEANGEQLHRNEAQTRLDLIDRLLACLGWTAPDIQVEVHHEGTYSDYQLGRPATRLLVEAKREGTYFTLPAGWTDRIAKISTVAGDSDAISDALDQALGYALRRGIPYAAVSNGWQIVAFIASRTDGVAPLDGDALVFPDLSSMVTDFRLLWDNLSHAGTDEDNLSRTLARPRPRLTTPRLSAKTPGYPGLAPRHEREQTLQMLGSVFVEDIATMEENERRFLIACYSHSGALSQYALASKEILRTRYSLLFDQDADYTLAPAMSHTGLDPNLMGDIAAASVKQRPIILLGDVGVGKTTFIKNLIQVAARDQLEHAIVFYLDFGKSPSLTKDLADYVGAEFNRQLMSIYEVDTRSDAFVRGVYHGQIEQFKNSIYRPLLESAPEAFAAREIEFLGGLIEDTEEHLKASLLHISRGRKQQVVVFLDNVDQRDSRFQNDLFVIAQTMAESWPVTVFLSLRPETFYQSRRSGSLSAYQPRAFTISPPRVEVVLKKRLSYALDLLKEEGGLKTRAGVEISIDLSTLIRFLETLQRSLEVNPALNEFLENVSNGNIREALGYLESYIGSPHVNLSRLLDVLADGRQFTIPIQDLVKSVALGDSQFYDPSRSPIGNIFDVAVGSRAEHFLIPILIEHLQRRGAEGTADGFVPVHETYAFAQGLGFPIDSVAVSLAHCQEWRFVTRSGFDRRNRDDVNAFRVAPCGLYATRKLARSFTYLDAVVDDTPIADPEFYASLNPMGHDRDISARMRRTERFVRYLDQSWETLGEARDAAEFDWPSTSHAIAEDIRQIRERIELARSRTT